MITGIKSGAVLQRGKDGTCETYIIAEGAKELSASIGSIEKCGDRWKLTGIPAGGPYDLTVYCDGEKYEFTDLYVGDLWLLGGQSNMEGAGVITERDEYHRTHPDEKVRAFYMEDEWGAAVPLLHRLWKSKDLYIAEEWKNYRKDSPWEKYDKVDGEYPYEDYRGIGPGFAFALEMQKITGVPQGLIPCGIGGSSLTGWDHCSETPNYYTSMIRRLKECGGDARGLYWDQGEAECSYAGVAAYNDRMKNFVDAVRKENAGDLAVVFDQIAYTEIGNENKDVHKCYSLIREKQRLLPEIIDGSDTVSTMNANLSDRIHKDSDSQYAIGKSAAISMAKLCGYGGETSIKFKGIKVRQNETIPFRYVVEVYYDNVIGSLTSDGVPRGFTIQLEGDDGYCFYPYRDIFDIRPEGNKVSIGSIHSYEQIMNADLWYGIGNNCVCNIKDGAGRYLPAMGPIKIKDNSI